MNDYDLIGRIDRPGEPTLNELIGLCLHNRTDRLCLVKEPVGKPPGLVILLIGPRALKEVGPFLANLVRTLRYRPDHVLHIKPSQSCRFMIEWLQSTDQQWAVQLLAVRGAGEKGGSGAGVKGGGGERGTISPAPSLPFSPAFGPAPLLPYTRAATFCLYGPFVNDALCAELTRLDLPCKLRVDRAAGEKV